MPRIDFPKVSDGYVVIPTGEYNIQISKAEITQNANEDEVWKLQMSILDGQYKGQKIFDRLVWSSSNPKALTRLKLLAKAIGMDVTKEQDFEISSLEGKKIKVKVELSPDEDGKERSKVIFAGYFPSN